MPLQFFLLGLLVLTGAGAAAGAYRRLQRNAASCDCCGSALDSSNEGSCAACGAEICTQCLRHPETGLPGLTAVQPSPRYLLCPGCAASRFPVDTPTLRMERRPGVGLALTDAAVGLASTTE